MRQAAGINFCYYEERGLIYDLIVIGGGLAGSALARIMASNGHSVLVLERSTTFQDRVRGEVLMPWGVAEAKKLGLHSLLLESCATKVAGWSKYTNTGRLISRRDLPTSSASGNAAVGFYHPEMQEVLLNAAGSAGATVKRGAKALGIDCNTGADSTDCVTVREGDTNCAYQGRLIVGADGRHSNVRKWAGFTAQFDANTLHFAGLLLEGLDLDQTSAHFIIDSARGQMTSSFPIGNNQFRTYFAQNVSESSQILSGTKRVPDFLTACTGAGMPEEWVKNVAIKGPLASFESAPNWVEHPSKNNVVLIGDAAATSDPIWGCGMSLGLRDARVLAEQLLVNDDWVAAGCEYADRHDSYFGAIHRIESWMTDLFLSLGTEANSRRSKAMKLIMEDPSRMPDVTGLGPESPSDEYARARFYGEE